MGGLLSKKPEEAKDAPHAPKLHLIQHHFSNHERALMREHLPDFVAYRPARPKDLVRLVLHWDQLNTVHDQPVDQSTGIAPVSQLFDVFYRYLFETVPDAHPLYHQSTKFKGRALMNIITGIRNLLQTPDVLEAAAGIAHRHVIYGVRREHFNPFGVALMRTLETLAPTLWTPQISDAWHRVYAHVAVLVLERLETEQGTPSLKPPALGPSLTTKPLTQAEATLLAQKYPEKDAINPISILYTPRGRPSSASSTTDVPSPGLVRRISPSPEKPHQTQGHHDDAASTTDVDSSSHDSLSHLTEVSTSTSLKTTSVFRKNSFGQRRHFFVAPTTNV